MVKGTGFGLRLHVSKSISAPYWFCDLGQDFKPLFASVSTFFLSCCKKINDLLHIKPLEKCPAHSNSSIYFSYLAFPYDHAYKDQDFTILHSLFSVPS